MQTPRSIDHALAKNYIGGWKQEDGSVPYRKLDHQHQERERSKCLRKASTILSYYFNETAEKLGQIAT
jgi:hypothetical protein